MPQIIRYLPLGSCTEPVSAVFARSSSSRRSRSRCSSCLRAPPHLRSFHRRRCRCCMRAASARPRALRAARRPSATRLSSARRSSSRSTARGVVPGTISLHVEVVPAGPEPRRRSSSSPAARARARRTSSASDSPTARRALPLSLPRLHARRLRRSRHRRVRACSTARRCSPQRKPTPSASPRRRAPQSIGPPRDFYCDGRPRRGPRRRPAVARLRQDRALRRLLRHEARDGVRARASRPRRAPAARLGAAARAAGSVQRERARTMPATLTAFCSDGGCRSATHDFAGDVVDARESARGEPAHVAVASRTARRNR